MDMDMYLMSPLQKEIERLFIIKPALENSGLPLYNRQPRLRHESEDSGFTSWEEFQQNGSVQELDDLDRLVRQMDLVGEADPNEVDTGHAARHTTPTAPVTSYANDVTRLAASMSPVSVCSSGYNSTGSPQSVSPGYSPPPPPVHMPGMAVHTSHTGPHTNMLHMLTDAQMIEIFHERERQKSRRKVRRDKVCVFCRNNGESEGVYTTHQLKDAEGNITCPVLYVYKCPICGVSGEKAHTIKYCPVNTGDRGARRTLKTPRNSAGRRVLQGIHGMRQNLPLM